MSFSGSGTYVIPLDRADVGKVIAMTITPASAEQSVFLTKLRQDRDHTIGVAFGFFAVLYGVGFMKMSTTGHSADDIARLRARRILLDEREVIRRPSDRLLSGRQCELQIRPARHLESRRESGSHLAEFGTSHSFRKAFQHLLVADCLPARKFVV
jgi:hypothetical protein